MVTWRAAGFIARELKKKGIKISRKEARIRLAGIEKETAGGTGCRIIFTMALGRRTYSANSLVPGTKPVLISAMWAVEILSGGQESMDAFLETAGHEMAHKEGFLWRMKGVHFARWVHEVFCDFRGSELALGGDRARTVRAVGKKMELKKNSSRIAVDEDYISHPSWERRKAYLAGFDFTPELVDQIAEDAGCKDEDVIRSVKKYFDGRWVYLKQER